MSARTASGLRWFKTSLTYVGWFAAAKAVLAFMGGGLGKGLAEALVLLLAASVLIGAPAFVVGWLRGGW